MKRQEDILNGSQRLAFYASEIEQSGETIRPKAVVLIVHGYAEHITRYTHVGNFLAQYRVLAVGIDLRGHGRSTGERALVRNFDDYCQDVLHAVAYLQALYDDLPFFILGHSNGGLVAVKTVLDYNPKLAGLILSGAALQIDEDVSPLLRKLAPLIGNIFPSLKTIKLDSQLVSRDPQVVAEYVADPLVYSQGIKAGYGAAVLRAIKDVGKRFGDLFCPLLIMHGEADKLTDPRGSLRLSDQTSSVDVTTKIWPGLYHEILNEPEREEVLSLIIDWILDRC